MAIEIDESVEPSWFTEVFKTKKNRKKLLNAYPFILGGTVVFFILGFFISFYFPLVLSLVGIVIFGIVYGISYGHNKLEKWTNNGESKSDNRGQW